MGRAQRVFARVRRYSPFLPRYIALTSSRC